MFTRRYKKCYCMNNNYTNDSCEMQNEIMEDKINEVSQSLSALKERTHLSELSDSRTQLLILINHYHDNHYAILKEAENADTFYNNHKDTVK